MNNLPQLLDELEQLVENGKLGFMGKRVVDEEAFFTQMQRIRSAMTPPPTTSGASKSVTKFIEESRFFTEKEQLLILAALANRLAAK